MSEAAAVRRLDQLVPLDEPALAALRAAAVRPGSIERGGNLVVEGNPIVGRFLLLEGWAGRVRVFEDGDLQILSLVLPGDLIGNCSHRAPISVSTIMALTDVRYCRSPSPDVSPALAEAYAVSRALDEAYLLSQIARLGRLSAEERLADLMLELRERLHLCGLADANSFELPLTQAMLADATGLTVVHVNRMVRQLRLHGDLSWIDGLLTLKDPAALIRRLGRPETRVNAM